MSISKGVHEHSESEASPPPLGWNTWACYGSLVTEAEVKANAEVMAEKLLPYGWDHVVIDARWFEPKAALYEPLTDGGVVDEFGRYLPAPNRFPSSEHGAGFKPLADYIHGLGLKFGIHIMRGIPKAAVRAGLPVAGSPHAADQVADRGSTCPWSDNNYGVDLRTPGGQSYYDSIVQLYGSWGVDLIKADNMVRQEEIDALARAMDRYGPAMTLSLVSFTEDALLTHSRALTYRISLGGGDVGDEWDDPSTDYTGLYESFDVCARFAPAIADGSYPDAGLLPLGRIGKNDWEAGEGRQTRLTPDEQTSLMTLWCICRSPLWFGGSLVDMDEFTLSLLTNPEVLAVNQWSRRNRPLYTEAERVAWVAEDRASGALYVALFNRGDSEQPVAVDLKAIGIRARADTRELWGRRDAGTCEGRLERVIPPHGSSLLRVRPLA